MPPTLPAPLPVRFRSHVDLTIHSSYLATAGVLQADPIAKVHIVTVKKRFQDRPGAKAPLSLATAPVSSPAGSLSQQSQTTKSRRDRSASPVGPVQRRSVTGGIHQTSPTVPSPKQSHTSGSTNTRGLAVAISAKTVGCTKPKYFTARPDFSETISFDVLENSSLTSLAGGAHSNHSTNSSAAVRDESVEDFIVVTVEDATGGSDRFYGEAYCPFSPHCPSTALPSAPVRVMLQPRNASDPSDPLFLKDMSTLAALRLDDFGFITISWNVSMIPHGGGAMTRATTHTADAAPATPAFPMGLTLLARWQAPLVFAAQPDAHFTTAVAFEKKSDAERFVFPQAQPLNPYASAAAASAIHDPSKGVVVFDSSGAGLNTAQEVPLQPLFLTIRSASQLLNTITMYLSVQSAQLGSHEVAVDLPLPALTTTEAFDRDLHWVAPARTAKGDDLGLLFLRIRLSCRPLEGNTPPCTDPNCTLYNDPAHQETFTHMVKDWTAAHPPQQQVPGAAPITTKPVVAPYPAPHAPFGAYQPLLWESAEHITRAVERSWKRGVIWDAQPTAEHVRHVFDVLMGRSQLDAGVAQVAATYFGRSQVADLTAANLKEFLIACAFNARGMSVVEAARFCFVALRRDVEDAVAAEEIHYMFAHALVGRTVDMSAAELRRWVTDIIGDLPAVSYADFTAYVLHNEGMWSDLGIPVYPDATFSSAQHRHHYCDVVAGLGNHAAAGQSGGAIRSSGPSSRAEVPVSTKAGMGMGVGTAAQQPAFYAPPPPFPASNVTTATSTDLTSATDGGTVPARSADSVWRSFVIRVPASGKVFSVTAHVNDAIAEVKRMVEESTGVAADRQSWHINGETPLENRVMIGATTLGIPPALKTAKEAEVWIREMEESVSLVFLYKHKKYQETFPMTEKVLRVRAHTQRWTRIPLSRCALKLRGAGGAVTVLQDRHPLSHYHPRDGDVIEISQE